ncbi:MAG: hypothetical protein Q8912_14765 [Bacillota bacterium]|nr:hypothetical protein [Bacillota bacterium]
MVSKNDNLSPLKAEVPSDPLGSENTNLLVDILLNTDGEGPKIGAMLLGTWMTLYSKDNPEDLAQAAHSARELIEKAPAYLGKLDIHTRKLGDEVEKLQKSWDQVSQVDPWPPKVVDEKVSAWLIDAGAFFDFVKKQFPSRRQQYASMVNSIDIGYPSLPKRIVEEKAALLINLRDYFNEVSHHRQTTDSRTFSERLIVLEKLLLDLRAPRPIPIFDEIDDLILRAEKEGISSEIMDELKSKLVNGSTNNYFFNTINSPIWIPQLIKYNYFDFPAEPFRSGDYVSFPNWAESGYLLRMVDLDPKEVLKAVKEIPFTENQRVLEEILQILLKVDPHQAVKFNQSITLRAINAPFPMRGSVFAAQLAVRFTECSEIGAARTLIGELLEVSPDGRPFYKHKKWFSPEPQIKFRDYDYEEILKLLVPTFAKREPLIAVDIFAGLLDKAVEYGLGRHKGTVDDDESAVDDYSVIWRTDIGSPRHSHMDQPRQGLVSALRDSLIEMLSSDISASEKLAVFKDLATRRYKVFGRIVEFVLRPQKDDPEYVHFYQALANTVEPILDGSILSRDPFEISPDAGISFEQLSALSNEELIDTLKNHNPKNVFFWRDNMADLFRSLIKSDIHRYATLAKTVDSIGYLYVNSFLDAIAEKVIEMTEKEFVEVLKLGERLLATKKDNKDTVSERFVWSKLALARVCEKALSPRGDKTELLSASSIPLIADVILGLARDESPKAKSEEGGMDPTTLSLNSVRGEAMHSLVSLIFWQNRNSKDEDILEKVYSELEWHLDNNNDPISAIRTVYGQNFPSLWASNKTWVKESIAKIFSNDEQGIAAWYSYINYNNVYFDLIGPTTEIIKTRLADLRDHTDKDVDVRDGKRHFVRYLMICYWNGLINLDEGGILSLFFDEASIESREEMMEYIGRELLRVESLDDGVRERLVKLWEFRLLSLEETNFEDCNDLKEFGGWFASGHFDDVWSLENLAIVIKKCHNASPDYMVAERLAKLSSTHPLEAINCLGGMISGARERWSISTWQESTELIIKNAFHSSDTKAKKSAEDQANMLVSMGYHTYRDTIKR